MGQDNLVPTKARAGDHKGEMTCSVETADGSSFQVTTENGAFKQSMGGISVAWQQKDAREHPHLTPAEVKAHVTPAEASERRFEHEMGEKLKTAGAGACHATVATKPAIGFQP